MVSSEMTMCVLQNIKKNVKISICEPQFDIHSYMQTHKHNDSEFPFRTHRE